MNDSLIHADTFFFTTTIVVVLVALGILIALFYLIRILRDASRLARGIREEGDAISADVGRVRRSVANFFARATHRARGRRTHRH